MRVPRPRIETIRRSRPESLSRGDYGIASTTTALINFVGSLQEMGMEGVSGYSLPHSVPFQLGATAAEALLSPARKEVDAAWAAYQVQVCWAGTPLANQALRSKAEADYVKANVAHFAITAMSGDSLCATGQIRYVRVRDGVNLATNRAIAQPKPDFLGADQIARTEAYSPFLLRLLMNPIAGGQEPLGRRLHPLGSVPLGAAVFQALATNPGFAVVSASMKYLSPAPVDTGFVTHTVLLSRHRAMVNFADERENRFATCSLELVQLG